MPREKHMRHCSDLFITTTPDKLGWVANEWSVDGGGGRVHTSCSSCAIGFVPMWFTRPDNCMSIEQCKMSARGIVTEGRGRGVWGGKKRAPGRRAGPTCWRKLCFCHLPSGPEKYMTIPKLLGGQKMQKQMFHRPKIARALFAFQHLSFARWKMCSCAPFLEKK